MTMIAKLTNNRVLDGFGLVEAQLPPGVERHHVIITRESATIMLDANESNRRLRLSVANTYARMMLAPGGWPYIGSPILIDRNGRIIDGQHRIKAVEICGVPLAVDVITGLDPKVQYNVDNNLARKVSDNLRMAGFKNTQTMSAGARALMWWGLERADDSTAQAWKIPSETFRPATAEVTAFAIAHPDLEDISGIAYAAYVASHVRPAIATAVLYRASKIDPFRAAEFFHYLQSGAGMEEGNPILTLRNRLSRVRRDGVKEQPEEHLFHVVNAWNKWVSRETNYRVQLPRDGVGPGSIIRLSDTILLTDDAQWIPRKDTKGE